MKKKISLTTTISLGLILNAIGFILVYVFPDRQHNWISIPILVIGSALLIISAIKSSRNNADSEHNPDGGKTERKQ